MMFYFNGNGDALYTVSESIYQGSYKANDIYFFCTTSKMNSVDVNFALPNGKTTAKFPLSLISEETDMPLTDETGAKFNLWHIVAPHCLTEDYGNVSVQFFITGTDGTRIATATQTIIVEEGLCDYNSANEEAYAALRAEMARIEALSNDTNEAVENALNKRSNETMAIELYAYSGTEQTSVKFSDRGEAGGAAAYNINGCLYTGTPKEKNDAVNKEYADSKFGVNVVEDYATKNIALTVQKNTEYYYGVLNNLELSFPSDGGTGDTFYLTFKNGDVAASVSVDTEYANLAEPISCSSGTIVEICGVKTIIGWNVCWREI